LQATTPVAVLLASWALGVAPPSLKTLGNVSFIVIGVIIASFGEIQFDLTGFLYQLGGITFEALRLVLVQKLLSSAEFKMDPLVSLYYFAPVCALMNGVVALIMEVPSMTMDNVYQVGFLTLLANAMVAFLLNVSVVFLIGKTSSLVLTLCGVLKDILLVGLSMLIWGTPVTALQFFGYGIALAGMMYYKLGAEQLKGYFNQAGMRWAEFGVQRPALRKIVVFGLVLLTFFLLLGGLAPTFAPEQTEDFKKLLGGATLGTK
jgi:drug/metabolite transporter (DMT)-like permease